VLCDPGTVAATPTRRTLWVPSRARPASLRAAGRAGADYGAGARPDWRATPFAARRLTIAGAGVHVVATGGGDGPPVLFVHGLGGSWMNWLENLPFVGAHRRALALDLPGFGESDLPVGEISITGYAALLETVCEALGLGAVELVGNSMGGFVAAEMALRHPGRVHRLVLVDAAGISIADLRRWPARTLMRAAAVQAGWGSGQRAMLARPRLRHLAFRTIMRHPTRMPLDLLVHQAGGPGMPGFLLAMDALLSYDFRERLGEIAAPTLIVHGEEDMLVPVADAREFARVIPDSRLVLLEDTGHVPMLERPATFNRVLGEFLGLG
jgi:pimeloyl-ACP methyl ester carboxylesterase